MAHQYGPCDSFFVVDDDEAQYHHQASRQRQIEAMRQCEAQRKHHQQGMLAQQWSEVDKDTYGDNILNWLHELELKTLPDVLSIDMQTEIKWSMRPYLMEFLIEVHNSLSLLPETLYLAVSILDRYCSRRVVFRKHFQLVGCTALLVASKYGEASKRVPHIRELQSMCCDQYEESMFMQMEVHVLTNLEWHVGAPTVDEFLNLALVGTVPDPQLKNMALYISQMALSQRDFVSVRPSEMAKCSLDLARIVTGKRDQAHGQAAWTFHYDVTILHALSSILHTPCKILRNLYRQKNLDCVSLILDDFLLRINSTQPVYPDTPPRQSSTQSEETVREVGFCHTPQKNPYAPNMVLTPPLTPEGEQFHAAQQKAYATHMTVPSIQVSAPATPTPTPDSAPYHQGHVYLQPMHHSAPAHYFDHNTMVM